MIFCRRQDHTKTISFVETQNPGKAGDHRQVLFFYSKHGRTSERVGCIPVIWPNILYGRDAQPHIYIVDAL